MDEVIKEMREITDKMFQTMNLVRAIELSPDPFWIKDDYFVMRKFNQAYVNEILIPNGYKGEEYIGKTDYEVHPDHIADEYRKNDLEVLNSDVPIRKVENMFIGGVYKKGIMVKFKYPIFRGGKVSYGVAGYIIDIEKIKL